MNVTINVKDGFELVLEGFYKDMEDVEIQMEAEKEAQEIEEFSEMMFTELSRDLNPPSRN